MAKKVILEQRECGNAYDRKGNLVGYLGEGCEFELEESKL